MEGGGGGGGGGGWRWGGGGGEEGRKVEGGSRRTSFGQVSKYLGVLRPIHYGGYIRAKASGKNLTEHLIVPGYTDDMMK